MPLENVIAIPLYSYLVTWRLKPQLYKRNLPTQVKKCLIFAQSAQAGLVCIAPEFHSEGLVQDMSVLTLGTIPSQQRQIGSDTLPNLRQQRAIALAKLK